MTRTVKPRLMMFTLFLLVSLVTGPTFALPQSIDGSQQAELSAAPVIVQRTTDGRILIGTDPESNWELFRLLADSQVRDEIKVSDTATDAYVAMVNKFKAERTSLMRAVKAGDVPAQASQAQFADFRQRAKESLHELLSPDQLTRLRQVAYRLELVRIGMPQAITQGRLSVQVGVYENQKTRLYERATELDAEIKAAIKVILRSAEDKLLAELTPEQATRARELLGEPLDDYRELSEGQILYNKIREMDAAEREVQHSERPRN